LDIESYLYEYQRATQDKERLLVELERVRARYEDAYDRQSQTIRYDLARVKKPAEMSVVERAAILIIDDLRGEVDAIERELEKANTTIRSLKKLIECLGWMEKNYIRMKYFEGRSNEYMTKNLKCSERTLGLLKNSALNKLEKEIN